MHPYAHPLHTTAQNIYTGQPAHASRPTTRRPASRPVDDPRHQRRRRQQASSGHDTQYPASPTAWAAPGHSIPSDHNHAMPSPGLQGSQFTSPASSSASLTLDDLVSAIGIPQSGSSTDDHSFSVIEMPSVLRDFFEGTSSDSDGTSLTVPMESFLGGGHDLSAEMVFPHDSPLIYPSATSPHDYGSPLGSPGFPSSSPQAMTQTGVSSPSWDMRSPGTTVVSDGDCATLVTSPAAAAPSYHENVDKELAAVRRAVRDSPRNQIRRRCLEAAALLLKRYNCRPSWLKTPSRVILEELVGLQRTVERETPRDTPDRIPCCVGLAASLEASYAYTADESELDAAIIYLEEAALLLSKWPDSPYRSNICLVLAQCHKHRYLLGRCLPDLEKSLAMQHVTLLSTSQDDPTRGRMCTRYAACLEKYFTAVRREVDLDLAIKLHREALALLPEAEQADVCSQLATCLRHRFELSGDERVFDEVILFRRRAVALMPKESRLLPYVLQDLAHALHQRFARTQDDILLEDVIKFHRAALTAFGTDDILRAESCANLGVALRSKYSRTGNVLLLTEMISVEEEALKFVEEPSWCGPAYWRVARSLREYFEVTRNPELMQKAVAYETLAQSMGARVTLMHMKMIDTHI
jgi:tetratricopeptide (TPR) repeat protein